VDVSDKLSLRVLSAHFSIVKVPYAIALAEQGLLTMLIVFAIHGGLGWLTFVDPIVANSALDYLFSGESCLLS
jgi:hypothetical protein